LEGGGSPARRRQRLRDRRRQGYSGSLGTGGGEASTAAEVREDRRRQSFGGGLRAGRGTAGGGASTTVGHLGTSSRSPTMSEPDGTAPAQTLGKLVRDAGAYLNK